MIIVVGESRGAIFEGKRQHCLMLTRPERLCESANVSAQWSVAMLRREEIELMSACGVGSSIIQDQFCNEGVKRRWSDMNVSQARLPEYSGVAVEVAFLWPERTVGSNKTRKVSLANKTRRKLAL